MMILPKQWKAGNFVSALIPKNDKKQVFKEIIEAEDPWGDCKTRDDLQGELLAKYHAAVEMPCHEIFRGCFLGNAEAFVESTGLGLSDVGRGKATLINPHELNHVITMCPRANLYGDYLDIPSTPNLLKTFQEHSVNWLHCGRTTRDHSDGWLALVHDCTFLDSELTTKYEFSGENSMTEDEFMSIDAQKRSGMDGVAVERWFEPIFQVLDKAFSEYGENVLCHCQRGASRSAAIIIAYLVNRLQVPATKAMYYVRSKRFCVDTKFMEPLQQYYHDLYPDAGLLAQEDHKSQKRDSYFRKKSADRAAPKSQSSSSPKCEYSSHLSSN
jgi:hypothetical protein